jgi:hypothetical protein
MMEPRKLFSPLALRPILALLAVLALALGMVAPHDAEVERAGIVSTVEIAETAVHPGDPAHVESAKIEVHPGCVACLLQLGSRTVLERAPALPEPLPPGGHVAAPTARIASANTSLLGPARAPPLASPFA